MLRELTALQLAEMIAYERIDRVPVTPEETAAKESERVKELFRDKGFADQ